MKKHDVSICVVCRANNALNQIRRILSKKIFKDMEKELFKGNKSDDDFHHKHGKLYGGTT